MNQLELWRLRRICDKYGLDYQEVDNSITYDENKKHLMELVRMLAKSLDVFELERYAYLQEEYMREHFLEFYIGCVQAGETVSKEVGEPLSEPHFSLAEFVKVTQGGRRH